MHFNIRLLPLSIHLGPTERVVNCLEIKISGTNLRSTVYSADIQKRAHPSSTIDNMYMLFTSGLWPSFTIRAVPDSRLSE